MTDAEPTTESDDRARLPDPAARPLTETPPDGGGHPITCEVSVVLPCLDEAETLATCIDKACGSLAALGVAGEVVVADNGSTDGSLAIAVKHGARVVPVATRGYGAALQAGIAAARGPYVVMADADDSYALEDLAPFVEALHSGADLVMGDRFAGGIEPGAMPRLHRQLGNPVLSWLGRRFFRVPIHDFHCGMRGFRRDAVLGLGLNTSGMEFASEMVVRAAMGGLVITEVPTTLRPDGRTRAPHLRTWRDGWRHLRFLLALSPPRVLLWPAIALVLVGSVAFGILAFGPVTVGQVTFDIQTMIVAAAMIVVGMNAAALVLVSRAYASRLGVLPRSERLERIVSRATLEWGLAVGALLGLAGIGCIVVAVLHWEGTDFGPLTTLDMRLPLAGMLLLVAGAQVTLVSFVLSLTHIGEGLSPASPAGPPAPAVPTRLGSATR